MFICAGVDRALAEPPAPGGHPADRLVRVAEWTRRAGPLQRPRAGPAHRLLERAPPRALRPPPGRPGRACPPSGAPTPGCPAPRELVAAVRDRALAALEREAPGADPAELARYCETAVRLGLSCVVAPPGRDEEHVAYVRAVLGRLPVREGTAARRVTPGAAP